MHCKMKQYRKFFAHPIFFFGLLQFKFVGHDNGDM